MEKILLVGIIVIPLVVFLAVFGADIADQSSALSSFLQNAGVVALISAVAFVSFFFFQNYLQAINSRIKLSIAITVEKNRGLSQEKIIEEVSKSLWFPFLFKSSILSCFANLYNGGKIVLVDGGWHPENSVGLKISAKIEDD